MLIQLMSDVLLELPEKLESLYAKYYKNFKKAA
jgi:hypothetical protein